MQQKVKRLEYVTKHTDDGLEYRYWLAGPECTSAQAAEVVSRFRDDISTQLQAENDIN